MIRRAVHPEVQSSLTQFRRTRYFRVRFVGKIRTPTRVARCGLVPRSRLRGHQITRPRSPLLYGVRGQLLQMAIEFMEPLAINRSIDPAVSTRSLCPAPGIAMNCFVSGAAANKLRPSFKGMISSRSPWKNSSGARMLAILLFESKPRNTETPGRQFRVEPCWQRPSLT